MVSSIASGVLRGSISGHLVYGVCGRTSLQHESVINRRSLIGHLSSCVVLWERRGESVGDQFGDDVGVDGDGDGGVKRCAAG